MAFPWAPVISAGASLLGGLFSARGSEIAASRSEDFSREMYQYSLLNGPSLEMEGLRRAGINPMLRYGSGGSGTPVSMPTMSFQNPLADFGAGVAGAASSAFGTMKLEQDIDESRQRIQHSTAEILRIGVDTSRIIADTSLTQQQRENAVAENGRILQQTALGVAEEFLRYAQSNLSDAQAAQAGAMVRLLGQQLSTEEARTLMMGWQASTAQAETNIRWAEVPRAQREGDFFASPVGRVVMQMMQMREATGASGLLGVGQAAVVRGLDGIEQIWNDLFEE